MSVHFEAVLLGFALTLITVAGQSTPWLSCRSMLTVFAVSSRLGFHSVSASHSNDSPITLKDHGTDTEERNLGSLCKKFAGCDRKYPARVLLCDKPRGKPPKTYCTNLSRKPQITRRINMGRSHCGACASVSGGDFATTQQLQDGVDLYLSGYYQGPPISVWNVSVISNFANLFSSYRTSAAARFNDDISMWDMSSATTTSSMFARAYSFDQPINSWTTTKVQDMSGMFSDAVSFNQDVSQWDVSNVETMDNMFFRAASFNQNLSPWSTSSLTTTKAMFAQATMFNGDVARFDVSRVTTMQAMFAQATMFNGDVAQFDVSRVTDISEMFLEASSFNQDLSLWDVSRVTDMSETFLEASRFNQDVSIWDVSNVKSFVQMFRGALSFDQNLCAWGPKIQSSASVSGMFSDSICPEQADPDLSMAPPGPFCFSCAL